MNETIPRGRNYRNLSVTILKQSRTTVNQLELTSCFLYSEVSYTVTP